jgi:hypothetical protein
LRPQKANNFQIVIGLFLDSGASKGEIEVLAHAGLSVSYTTIIAHVRLLSKKGSSNFRDIRHRFVETSSARAEGASTIQFKSYRFTENQTQVARQSRHAEIEGAVSLRQR